MILADGSTTPKEYVEEACGRQTIEESGKKQYKDYFDKPSLDPEYQSLRIPTTERPGYLRMYGRSGLSSKFSQTLIAKRLTEFDMDVILYAKSIGMEF